MQARMLRRILFVMALIVLVGLWIPQLALAVWPGDPSVNVPICLATDDQTRPAITSDDSSGAIITWRDYRNGTDYNIYAQRVDDTGAVKWTADGVAICIALEWQNSPDIVSNGSGGAIIAWDDSRNGYEDIYAQRINASGSVQWTTDGVAICTESGAQTNAKIVSDGSGGAIITWSDYRTAWQSDIYAQRVNASGVTQWTTNGVPICTASNNQYYQEIISDGSGGAIIVWQDERRGFSNPDIYAQRVNASGVVQWTANGDSICTAPSNQHYPKLVSDGSGGAIITWYDERNGNYDIYAQRINASGVVQWTTNGVPICTATNQQADPVIASDGSGGAIIAWRDFRSGNDDDIYAQRINASGVVQWTANGIPICNTSDSQVHPFIVSDGTNGAIIAWNTHRMVGFDSYTEIYAQRVNSSGTAQWTTNGVAINKETNWQEFCGVIVSDDANGAIIAWEDQRSLENDIYAQRVYSDGSLTKSSYPILLCWDNGDNSNRDSLRKALQAAVSYGIIPGWDEYERSSIHIDLTLWETIVYSETGGITASEADSLMNFLDSGTASAEKTLIIAGDDIGYEQRNLNPGNPYYQAYNNYLHANYIANDGQGSSGMHSIEGRAINNGIIDSMDSASPDVVEARPEADTGYVFGADCDSAGSACCVVYDGATYNTIYYSMEWQEIKADIIQVFVGPEPSHNDGNFGWTGNAGGTLPVELSTFTAFMTNQNVTLNWTTATETDNLGFNILRGTTDAVNDAVKVNHNIISGQGTSSVPTEYSYVDNSELIPETTYWYWLESIDYQGNSELYGPISVKFELEEEPSIIPELPDKYGLFQNYPNPFNPDTQIYFKLENECSGELSIYNIKGEKITTIFEGEIEKDKLMTVSWNGRDETGKEVGSGIYLYKLKTKDREYSRKMIILK